MLYSKKENSILQWKETLLTTIIILACLLLSTFYPTADIGQNITSALFFLVLIPLLYLKLILKKSLADFGFSLQNARAGFLWGGIMLTLSLLLSFLLFHFTGLKATYVLPIFVMTNFWFFLLYELLFVSLLVFLQDAFFKGFVLFSFTKKFNYWAIVFSSGLYFIFLALTGNFGWQTTPYIILSLAGGVVAYKSRSFLYAYFMSLFFLIFFDAYLIYILK